MSIKEIGSATNEQMILLPVQYVCAGRGYEAKLYVEALEYDTPSGCILPAHLFAREDGTGTVGVLLPEMYASHRVKGGALSVKICLPSGHIQDSTDDLWRLVEGAPTTPVKGMDGVLNSVVLPGCFVPAAAVEPVVIASASADPVAPSAKSRRGRQKVASV